MINISVETLESLPYLIIIRSGHEPFHVVVGQNLIQRYDHTIPPIRVGRMMRPRKVHDLGKGTYGRLQAINIKYVIDLHICYEKTSKGFRTHLAYLVGSQ